jgi:hypothetical protein
MVFRKTIAIHEDNNAKRPDVNGTSVPWESRRAGITVLSDLRSSIEERAAFGFQIGASI